MFVTILALIAPAHAECTKDTDCKGDRVCEAGTCEDPGRAAPPTRAARSSRSDLDPADQSVARAARGGSLGLGIVGWSLTGQGALLGVTGSVLGLAEAGVGVSVGVGGVGLLSLAAAGPVAAASSGRARAGLKAIGRDPGSPGLSIAGWSCYGMGMLLGIAAVGVGIEGDSAGGAIGLAAVVPATLGSTFLLIDAGKARARLDDAIVRGDSRPPLQVAPTAWITPEGGGGGLTATW